MKALLIIGFLHLFIPGVKGGTEETHQTEVPRRHRADDSLNASGTVSSFSKNQFTLCGTKTYSKCGNIQFITAYTTESGRRFSPGHPSDPEAKCRMLAIKQRQVEGRKVEQIAQVQARGVSNSIDTYTRIPGEYVGKPGKNFMILPNPDRNSPPFIIPSPCDLQDTIGFGLALRNGPEAPEHNSYLELQGGCVTEPEEQVAAPIPPGMVIGGGT